MRVTAILLFALALAGCSSVNKFVNQTRGSGVMKTERRNVGSFTAVDASGAYEVEIVSQQSPGLELEGDDNILPLVKTEVRDDTLYLSSDKPFSVNKAVRVRINMPDIKALSSSGATNFDVTGVKNEGLTITTNGASSIRAAGETRNLRIKSSGASTIDTEELKASIVSISLSGAGKVTVYASEELDAKVSGAGSITYAGDPKVVNRDVSGIGSINKK